MRRDNNNFLYHLKESIAIFNYNRLANSISILSNGLIFFIFALVLSGGYITQGMVESLKDEAEIAIYLKEDQDITDFVESAKQISTIEGVTATKVINEDEAYQRMLKIFGEETSILSYLEVNPFTAFIEVSIDLAYMDSIIQKIKTMPQVEAIKENRDVLGKIGALSEALNVISLMIIIAVGITTLVTLSYTIRQSIYHYREHITTLQLLGAPKLFIGIPFYIMGICMTLISGIIAIGMISLVIDQGYKFIYGPLPFIILPKLGDVLTFVQVSVIVGSGLLGLIGCSLGMKSIKL